MADLLDELQRMAANIGINDTGDIEPSDIKQWQRVFDFSHTQAKAQIQQYREDIGRSGVSDDHWRLMQEEKEAEGHTRETYEYSLQHRNKRAPPNKHRPSIENATYLIKLEPPFLTTAKIRDITGIEPHTNSGTGETGDAKFCKVNADHRRQVLDWAAKSHLNFVPTVVRLSMSPKELCGHSRAPFLGIDTTLPQHRATNITDHTSPCTEYTPLPGSNQYPVLYFFYGNLARSEELQTRLNLEEPPTYVPARVHRARIRSWRGQYRALVDADEGCFEDGSAYLVKSKEEEDALRFYETEKYEVVRCEIEMGHGVEPGLVFRFAGGEDELQ